jgi:hypothetical protein
MKDKTIDYILRATWQVVSRMYNEEASVRYNGNWVCFIEYGQNIGTPSTSLGPKWEWRLPVLPEP